MPVKIPGRGIYLGGPSQSMGGIKLLWDGEGGAVTVESEQTIGMGTAFLYHLDLVSSLWAVGPSLISSNQ